MKCSAYNPSDFSFLAYSSLEEYLKITVLLAGKSIFDNYSVLGGRFEPLFIKKIFYNDKSIYKALEDLSFEDYLELCKEVGFIHDSFAWGQFVTAKGRTVNYLKDEWSFLLPSHEMVKTLRTKVLFFEYKKAFPVFTSTTFTFEKDLERDTGRYLQGTNYVYCSKTDEELYVQYGKVINIPRSALAYYVKNCSFGVSSGAFHAAKKHSELDPHNMVTFDISNFFGTFTIDKIKKAKLFENIFEWTSREILDSKAYSRDKLEFDPSFVEASKYFYPMFEAFSFKGVLPTGSVFSSHMANLLFFSIDLDIRKMYMEEFSKKTDPNLMMNDAVDEIVGQGRRVRIEDIEHPNLSQKGFSNKHNTFTPIYTRYIDDIAISINLSFEKLFAMRTANCIEGVPLFPSNIYDSEEGERITDEYSNIVKEYFLNISIIKKIETILNKSGFFLKYEKTKIFSYKMDKNYLGYSYVLNCNSWRDKLCHLSARKGAYSFRPKSIKKHNFRKTAFNYVDLNIEERYALLSTYHAIKTPEFERDLRTDRNFGEFLRDNDLIFDRLPKRTSRKVLKLPEIK